MSEGGVGAVERELLERARDAEVARRRGYFARLELVAELERLGVAAVTGDRGTVRLLQAHWHLDRAEATRLVAEAADLVERRSLQGEVLPPRLACTATVGAAGEIGAGHIAVIRRTMTRLDRIEALDVTDWVESERFLAEEATRLSPAGLAQLAKALIEYHDPDGEAPREGEDRCDELHVVRRRDGTLAFTGRLHDPVDAEVLLGVLDPLAEPLGPEDTRSLERRRMDALKEVIEDAAGGGAAENAAGEAVVPAPQEARPATPGRVLLTITMDHRWLARAVGHGMLDSGALINPHTVRRLACDAGIIPMLLGSRSEPLDVGRQQRTAPDAIRRALQLRDGGCAFPGCTRPPRRCHAHHIRSWLDGGDTCLENMCLLCRFHHQLIHHGHWTITMSDGRPWFTPPDWHDPDRRPRPGGQRPVFAAARACS